MRLFKYILISALSIAFINVMLFFKNVNRSK